MVTVTTEIADKAIGAATNKARKAIDSVKKQRTSTLCPGLKIAIRRL